MKKITSIFLSLVLLLSFIQPIIALENETPIIGEPQVTKNQLIEFYEQYSIVSYPQSYIEQGTSLTSFIDLLWTESQGENIRPEIVMAVIMSNTNYLSFNEGILIQQNNLYSLENKDIVFNNLQEGIRGIVQHIKGYATQEKLNKPCVDPLYNEITLGIALDSVQGLRSMWGQETNNYSEMEIVLKDILNTSVRTSTVDPSLHHSTDSIKWDEDNLQISGWGYLEGINISSDDSVKKEIVIKNSAGSTVLRVTADDMKYTAITKKYGANRYNYDYSGFYVNIPVSSLPKDGSYTLYLEVSSGSIKKQQVMNMASKTAMKEVETKGINNISYSIEWVNRELNIIRNSSTKALKQETTKVSWSGNNLRIEGRVIFEGVDMTTHSQVEKEIIIKDANNKEIARYKAIDKIRTDITDSKGTLINYNYCGYQVDIPMTKLASNGTYNIYIELNVNGYSKTVKINNPVAAYAGRLKNNVVSNKLYQPEWSSQGLTIKRYTPSIQQYTDNLQWSSGKLVIEGWALINNINVSSDNSIAKAIVIKNASGSELARYSATDIVRSDITSNKGGGIYNYDYSGYKASISMSSLQGNGKYKVYIEIKAGGATIQQEIKNPSSNAKDISSIDINKTQYTPSWGDGILTITKNRAITIMIDPGHEGRYPLDSGAAQNGLLEYKLNNALAKKIAAKLEAQGYNIEYTRNPNIEAKVPLWGRDEKVNEVMPDLLISLHHDSSTNKSARGFSIHWSSYRYKIDRKDIFIYFGSEKYPVISQFQRMEEVKEHTYVTYVKGGKNYTVDISGLNLVVRDSSLSSPAAGSKKFAYILYDKLKSLDYLGQRYNPVSDHNLYMTRETNVPTILVEAGFISNPTEAKNVNNSTNQDKFTNKMVDAINEYFN